MTSTHQVSTTTNLHLCCCYLQKGAGRIGGVAGGEGPYTKSLNKSAAPERPDPGDIASLQYPLDTVGLFKRLQQHVAPDKEGTQNKETQPTSSLLPKLVFSSHDCPLQKLLRQVQQYVCVCWCRQGC